MEKGLRSGRALKLAIAEMYLQGVSTRKVSGVLEKMCGLQITSFQVSRATAELDAILKQWRERPLSSMRYLILDARYEKVRQNGAVLPCAVLIAIGVDELGKRSGLASPASSPKRKCIGATSWKACKTAPRWRSTHC